MQPASPVNNPNNPGSMLSYEEAQANAHLFQRGFTYYWSPVTGSYVPQPQGSSQPVIDLHGVMPGLDALGQSGQGLSRWRVRRRV